MLEKKKKTDLICLENETEIIGKEGRETCKY